MPSNNPLRYIERKTGDILEEKIAGDKFLHWLYETRSGAFCLGLLFRKKIFSYLYGKIQDTSLSRRKIKRFVEVMQIDMTEALIEQPSSYTSFNEFFTRKLKPQVRPLNSAPGTLVSPADGRLFAWENFDAQRMLQIKGSEYTLQELTRNTELAAEFSGGTCIVIRLSPADYHRFHFPDDGRPSVAQKISGLYYSVNPKALGKIPRLYCQNKRELTLFDSANFGKMLLVEIGATCVGSIVQTYVPDQPVQKGAEKGYFKFGGSTVLMLLAPGKVVVDPDLLEHTQKGLETKVRMGERIGIRPQS